MNCEKCDAPTYIICDYCNQPECSTCLCETFTTCDNCEELTIPEVEELTTQWCASCAEKVKPCLYCNEQRPINEGGLCRECASDDALNEGYDR